MEKKAYSRFCDQCEKFLFPISMVLCIAMLIVAILHVIMRYVFSNALTWSEEFLRFSIVWFSLVSAAVLHHRKGHVGIIIFRDMFPDRIRAACIRLIPVLEVIATASVTYSGISLLLRTYKQITPALGISVAIPYSAIPFGCFFMTLFSIEHVLEITFGESVAPRKDPTIQEGE